MLSSSNNKTLFSFAITSNTANTILKFVNKEGAKTRNKVLGFKQMTQSILGLKTTIFHCSNVFLTDL